MTGYCNKHSRFFEDECINCKEERERLQKKKQTEEHYQEAKEVAPKPKITQEIVQQAPEKHPDVMICLMTKGGSKHLENFLNLWNNIRYPIENLRFVIIYGDMKSKNLVEKFFMDSKTKFNWETHKEPQFKNLTKNSLWIADVCNHFKKFYHGEPFILMADDDIALFPPNLLIELIKADKDVIAPYVYQTFDPSIFFDTYCFRKNGGKHFDCARPHMKDSPKPVELDSVGTMFLLKWRVFLETKWENPSPHFQFMKNAKKAGYKIWGLPYLKIYHADVRQEAPTHLSVEDLVKDKILPKSILKKMEWDV